MSVICISSRDSLKDNFKTRKCKDSDNEMVGWSDGGLMEWWDIGMVGWLDDGMWYIFVCLFVILMIRGVIE